MAAAILLTLALGYLLGSIPTGFLVGRARGLDLRSVGSGNIGATNAFRILGKPAGTFVLIVDALKGLAGCTLAPQLAFRGFLAPAAEAAGGGATMPIWLPVLGGLAAVLGHNFTCWLRFKGGKGIATSAGVLMGVLPVPFLVVLAVFLVGLALSRIVSLSALLAALALPVATWLWRPHGVLMALSVALTGLAFYRHRANIQRLLAGVEPRIGQRPRNTSTPTPPSP